MFFLQDLLDAGASGLEPRLPAGTASYGGRALDDAVAIALARSPARLSGRAVPMGAGDGSRLSTSARTGEGQQLPDEGAFLEQYTDQERFYEMRARYGDLLHAYYDSRTELERLRAVRFFYYDYMIF